MFFRIGHESYLFLCYVTFLCYKQSIPFQVGRDNLIGGREVALEGCEGCDENTGTGE